jgi:hypothetical protein
MTDWRTKPRTGRSQFIPLINEIQNRLSQGETNKQIHDSLTAQNKIEIGYDQFARYIRNYLKAQKHVKTALTPKVMQTLKKPNGNHPFNFSSSIANGERRREHEFHNSVPDLERIYQDSHQVMPAE